RGGIWPFARLLPVNGALYGTASQGGAHDAGTVFVVTTDGKGRTLHSFSNLYRDDGNLPQAGLTDVKGTLYGTTPSGGGCDVGTVYSITTTGVERVLHSFADGILCQGQIDGAIPTASLIDVNGLLYGTTEDGGGFPKICHNGRSYIKGCGTVFSITTAGQVKLLRRFH
ncbi:MAG TPA: choice-of-anchor tandem repeat GloVer-containing protein, partial [Candidatus Nitrosotalea sp.]|nr:choice-of-anchor tandem repeat GloVer-containing protein [Candidatus Nitrosotalea sp.]